MKDMQKSAVGYDIPTELIELRDVAQKAVTINTCGTFNTRKAAISATATILGVEADLIKYCNDPNYSEDAHRLACQLLTATNPKEYDFSPKIGILWGRKPLRDLVSPLAEASLAVGHRLLKTEPESLLVKECIGYGKILEDAKKKGITLSPRTDLLIQCCQRMDAAIKAEDYMAEIGYIPYINPNQMMFPFYFMANNQPLT